MTTSKDKVTMLGWAGRWDNGDIGWRTSTFVARGRDYDGLDHHQREGAPMCGDVFERVRITVEVVRDKRGRKIVKRYKP